MGYQDRAPDPLGKTGSSGGLVIVDGIVRSARVNQRLVANLNHGPLLHINAIVVHQTDSSTAVGTLAGYEDKSFDKSGIPKNKDNGAHFLIDKDGSIYQTASLTTKCWHVGPIYAQCFKVHRCIQEEEKQYTIFERQGRKGFLEEAYAEMKKPYPARFPDNSDSIGIEIVGIALGTTAHPTDAYEAPTDEEQRSLQWLVQGLLASLSLKETDIYKHPQISRKTAGEARDADWHTPNPSFTTGSKR